MALLSTGSISYPTLLLLLLYSSPGCATTFLPLSTRHYSHLNALLYPSLNPKVSSSAVYDSVIPSTASSWRSPSTCTGRYSSSLKAQKGPSNHRNRRQQQSRPPQQIGEQFVTVTNVLDNYMKSRDRLKPYQVAAVWNKLGKAVQQSRNKREQRNFWLDNESNVRMLVAHTTQLVDDFNGQSTATVTHSLAKLTSLTGSNLARVQSLWNALLVRTAVHLKSDNFDGQSLSNLLWAYAKTHRVKTHPRLLDALANTAMHRVSEFKPQGLANVAWSYATMNHEAPELFDAIATAAQERIDDFKPQEVSNVAWAYATMNHEVPELFDVIATAAQERIDDFKPQALSNTAWSFATLKYEAPLLFDAIATAAHDGIDKFEPQNLSNTAWAFATLNYKAPSPLLFDAIATAAQERIDDFNPQNLANTAWAFATLNYKDPSLFDAIAKAAQERIGDFNQQNLANTAWAFATLKYEAPMLFNVISTTAQERIDDFKPQGLANVAWAYATMKHEAPALFDAIAKAAQERIGDFNQQNLANTAWAFATLNHNAPLLFDAIARTAQERIDDFKPQEVSNIAWAYATMNHEVPELFDAIATAAQECIHKFEPQALSNSAWAFAVFNIDTKSSLTDADSPFTQTLLSTEPTSFSIENLSQLHQYHLWCREQNTLSWISDELKSHCMDSFVSTNERPSRLQNDVVASLEMLQEVSQVQEEFRTSIGYSLDAVIAYRGNKIGIEVDGPSHFVGRSQSPNGNTILKHRQLRTLEGWNLVSIPYWEWYEICAASGGPTLESNKQAYLRNLLDGAVVV